MKANRSLKKTRSVPSAPSEGRRLCFRPGKNAKCRIQNTKFKSPKVYSAERRRAVAYRQRGSRTRPGGKSIGASFSRATGRPQHNGFADQPEIKTIGHTPQRQGSAAIPERFCAAAPRPWPLASGPRPLASQFCNFHSSYAAVPRARAPVHPCTRAAPPRSAPFFKFSPLLFPRGMV